MYAGKSLDNAVLDPIANLTESFGGRRRLKRIKNFIERLRSRNASVKIVSTSWAPVSQEQWKEYIINVTNTFDLGFGENDTLSLEDPGPGFSADKGAAIKIDMEKDEVNFDSALFADDSRSNIQTAKEVCNTLLLPKRLGLDGTDCAYIEALVSMKRVLGFQAFTCSGLG